MFDDNILSQSAQLIHLDVSHRSLNRRFACSFVYGFNNANMRNQLWGELEQISLHTHDAWFVGGPFNCPLHCDDRIGSPVRLSETTLFKGCIDTCELMDMKWNGSRFTWNNKQEGDNRVFSKIDKALINMELISSFPNAETSFLLEGLFDHCPAIVKFMPAANEGYKPFKYFNMWSSTPNFMEKVCESWNVPVRGTPMFCMMTTRKRLKPILKEINIGRLSDIERKVEETKMVLIEL